MIDRLIFSFCIIIILSVFSGFDLYGQEQDLLALERKVKDSANGYLYTEATGDNEEEALAAARDMLRPSVETNELKNTYVNWKDIANCVVDSAEYFTKPRGNKMRAVVYLLGSDLPELIKKYSGATPAADEPVSGPSPVSGRGTRMSDEEKEAMIQTIRDAPDDYMFAEATGTTQGKAIMTAQEKLGRPIMRVLAEYPALEMDTEMVKSVAYDTESITQRQGNVFYALAYLKLSAFHCNLRRGFISGWSHCEGMTEEEQKEETKVKVDHTEAGETRETTEEANETPAEETVDSAATVSLLEEIMSVTTINRLRDVFIANKNKGKLAYGQLMTMSNPESSYLVVYNNVGEILTFYGKGTSTRKNLKTGNTERYEEAYPEGKVMWFQIYE